MTAPFHGARRHRVRRPCAGAHPGRMRTRPGGGTDHVPVTGPSEPQVRLDAVPRRLRPMAEAVLAHRLGGLLLRVVGEVVRVQLFDRSMTLAAQAFTSVFPILIMFGALSGAA